MSDALPVVGAAMRSKYPTNHVDWLLENQRDLEIQDTIAHHILDGDWQMRANLIRSMLDGHTGRVGIHGPFDGFLISVLDKRIQALVQERFIQALEFGAVIGATHMVVHSPFFFMGDSFTPHSRKQGQHGQISRVLNTLAPIVERAEAMKCTIVIETILDRHSGPLLALVEAFESKYVRLSLDTGHAFIAHKQGHGPSPDQWVLDGIDVLAHVHLQDTDGIFDRHWMPGKGNINWYALFRALRRLDKMPRLILEMRRAKEIIPAARWLAEQGYVV